MSLSAEWKSRIQSLSPEERPAAKKAAKAAYMERLRTDELEVRALKAQAPEVQVKEKAKAETLAQKEATQKAKTEARVQKMLAGLEANLIDGEHVISYLEASSAEPAALGLLALTNLRLRFTYRMDRTTKYELSEDFLLSDIQTVSHNLKSASSLHRSRLWITVGKKSRYFASSLLLQDDFNKFAEALAREALNSKNPRTQAGSAGNLPEELSKLGALRESGLLTEDEFKAAKAKLLGIAPGSN